MPDRFPIKELMVDLKEFYTISIDSTFIEAHAALEKARQEFQSGLKKYQILMVKDNRGRVIGKLSPMDLIQGLEPKYRNIIDPNSLRFKDALYVIESMKTQKVLWDKPLGNLCRTAQHAKIKDFLKFPVEGHQISEDSFLDEALHLFVVGRHDSLFVLENKKLVGLLVFADVYDHISQKITAECQLPS